MGNLCRVMSSCNCFVAGSDDSMCLIENIRMPDRICNVFTISDSFRPTSLNECRLNNELIAMNLTKISNQFWCSSYSLDSGDSGYSSPQSIDYDALSIQLDSISQYSSRVTQIPFNLPLMFASFSNIPFLVNHSFNQMINKTKSSPRLFSSKFITTVKKRILKKSMKATRRAFGRQNYKEFRNPTDVASQVAPDSTNRSEQLVKCKPISIAGAFPLRTFLLRIYDVNFF